MPTDESEPRAMATTTVERGHERRDVNVAAVLALAAALLVACIAIQGGLYLQLRGMWKARQTQQTPAPSVAAALPAVPPAPRLQTAPREDLRALRAREEAQLEGYAWVDPTARVVRIPIERAMDLLAQEARR